MAHYRNITVDEKVYQYHIGYTGVKIRSNPAFFIPMDKLTGMHWYDLEKARFKGCAPQIGPKEIASLIKRYDITPA